MAGGEGAGGLAGWRDADLDSTLREVKAARREVAGLWADTADRLGELERALEAERARRREDTGG